MRFFSLCFFALPVLFLNAQDVPIEGQKRILFPHPMDRKWQVSVGITSTTMPRDITEELHFSVPAGDIHAIKKLSDKMYLDGRVNFQIFQNMISLGPRWSKKVTDRISMAVGNDLSYWFGSLNLENVKTRGSGWQNYPNISLGYRFNKAILLTVKAESIMNFRVKTYTGEVEVTSDYRLFSGSAYTVALEQPFFGKKSMTLGLRAIYSDFFWQTWSLYESFDRNILFPQLIVGLIL